MFARFVCTMLSFFTQVSREIPKKLGHFSLTAPCIQGVFISKVMGVCEYLRFLKSLFAWVKILDFSRPPKIVSTHSKRPTERDGAKNDNKVHVRIIYKSYVIVKYRIRWDGP